MGYRCIAAEVRLPPLGIIDAVGTGIFRAYHNYLFIPRELPQACFIECKASSAEDFAAPRFARRLALVNSKPASPSPWQTFTTSSPRKASSQRKNFPRA